jgi:hypothetical protein
MSHKNTSGKQPQRLPLPSGRNKSKNADQNKTTLYQQSVISGQFSIFFSEKFSDDLDFI